MHAWGSPGEYDKWKLTLGAGVTFTVCDISALLVVGDISVTLVAGDISAALAGSEISVMLAVGDISATFVLWDTLGNVSYEKKQQKTKQKSKYIRLLVNANKYYIVDGVHLLRTGATSDEKRKEW